MMERKEKTPAKTMRIDLIPGISDVPLDKAPKRVAWQSGRGGRPEKSGSGVLDRFNLTFFQSIYDAAFVTDLTGRIEEANTRAVDFFNYRTEKLRSMRIQDLISGADDDLLKTLTKNLEHDRFSLIQAYCPRHDGSFFPAEIAVSRIDLGEYHLCFFLRDITVRREAEEMLRMEHQAIQNAAEGIAMTGLDGNLEYVNPATLRHWGYDDEENLLGRHMSALLDGDKESLAKIERVAEDGKSWSGEVRARRRDGSVFFAKFSVMRNVSTDGYPTGMVLSMADLTDQRRAEDIRRESEKQRVMLESIGTACHHLGQPATVLLGTIEMLGARLGNESSEVVDLVATAAGACGVLRKILTRLHDVHEYCPVPYMNVSGEKRETTNILDI